MRDLKSAEFAYWINGFDMETAFCTICGSVFHVKRGHSEPKPEALEGNVVP
jgi:hypothetical protein